MKRLTYNRVASAGFRKNRRAYNSLMAGIFLSLFLVSAFLMAVQGVLLAQKAEKTRLLGFADGFLFNNGITDGQLRQTGLFDRVGHVYVTAKVNESDKYMGYDNEIGAALMNRRCVQGRLPQAAGELAAEQSALDALQIKAAVGDTLSLSLTPIDGVLETRAFTLVGLLHEQTAYLDVSGNMQSSRGTLALPSLLVSSAEPPFQTGRVITHRALTVKPFVTSAQLFSDAQHLSGYVGVSLDGPVFYDMVGGSSLSAQAGNMLALLLVLFSALILAACVGVSGAMEGRLSSRKEEIGMLRAVGATKRQVRRIFGREALTLSLLLTPLSLACAWLVNFGLARLMPDAFVFAFSPWLLLPIFVFSWALIALASSLPLRRAARQMPMGVLRDTTLLRKSKAMHAQTLFSPARLIALRQCRLYPTRPLGACALVALMTVCAALGVGAALESRQSRPAQADFTMGQTGNIEYGTFYEDQSNRFVSEQDMNEAASLSAVASVTQTRSARVNLVTNAVPSFFLHSTDKPYLLTQEQYLSAYRKENARNDNVDLDDKMLLDYYQQVETEYNAAREALQLERDQALITQTLYTCEIDPAALAPYVAQGSIDLAALDEGRAVIAYTPDSFLVQQGDSVVAYPAAPEGKNVLSVTVDDSFSAGQSLRLTQLYTIQPEGLVQYQPSEAYAFWRAKYESLERSEAATTVGAVLKGNLFAVLQDISGPCLITTKKGAQALGLSVVTLDYARIYLDDHVSIDTEKDVEKRLTAIALRANQTKVTNHRARMREANAYTKRLAAVLFAVLVLFFATSVAMITSGVTRRIRSDARLIGTLRAVGADEKVLLSCYGVQGTLSVLLGFALGLGLFALVLSVSKFPLQTIVLAFAASALFAALCFVSCRVILRLRVREVTQQSIVENIREL